MLSLHVQGLLVLTPQARVFDWDFATCQMCWNFVKKPWVVQWTLVPCFTLNGSLLSINISWRLCEVQGCFTSNCISVSFCSHQQHTDQAQVTNHKWFDSISVVAEGTFHCLPSLHKAGGTEGAEGKGKPRFFLLCSMYLLMTNMLTQGKTFNSMLWGSTPACSQGCAPWKQHNTCHSHSRHFHSRWSSEIQQWQRRSTPDTFSFFPPLRLLSQTGNWGSLWGQCVRVLHF